MHPFIPSNFNCFQIECMNVRLNQQFFVKNLGLYLIPKIKLKTEKTIEYGRK